MFKSIAEFYRFPKDLVSFDNATDLNDTPGFFRYGRAIGYGPSCSPLKYQSFGATIPVLHPPVVSSRSPARPPFDADAAVDNLRYERYPIRQPTRLTDFLRSSFANSLYYSVRPWLGDRVRAVLQKVYFRRWERLEFPRWPVDTSVETLFEELLVSWIEAAGVSQVPFIWFWPNAASAAITITHDVETEAGLRFIPELLDIDANAGIRTSYQLIPERRYRIEKALRDDIRMRGCEVNVHGLDHDRNLFFNRRSFEHDRAKINRFVDEYAARGFRAPCMYRNQEWLQELSISYDMSIPNVAHLEPQRGGCCTVFPYYIGPVLELPLTTVQDYTLFRILRAKSIDLWRQQIAEILQVHGFISFNIHPDYLLDEVSRAAYTSLLGELVSLRSSAPGVWIAPPGDIDTWWRLRSQLTIQQEEGCCRISGEGSEAARVAWARVESGRLVYNVN